jgi:ABC-type dipeptide/oligopeptide/nickel transport system permease component
VGTIPTLIIVVTFVFFFVRLIPGDPARLVAGEQATQDDVEAVREELGLNKSIPTQYVTYVTGLLKGNLGTSLRTKQPVTKEVDSEIPFVWHLSHCCGARLLVCSLVCGPEHTGENGRIIPE